MDDAVADETPKAGLGEMLRPKPAFRHQRLGGFLHDRMSQPAVPFPPREYRGLRINGQEARLWSGRQPPHLVQDTCFVAHCTPGVRQASCEVKAGADWNGCRITCDEVQLASAHASQLDRKSTRLNSSHLVISYAVFCLKKKKKKRTNFRNETHS